MNEKVYLSDMLNELSDASLIEGSEVGEYWAALVDAEVLYNSYYASDELKKAYEAEVSDQYKMLKTEFKVVDRSETVINRWKELELINE